MHAVVLAQLNRLPEALEALQQAARLDARDPQIHAALGEVCLRMKRLEDARKHFATAVELMPDSIQAHVGLAAACIELGDIEGARAQLVALRRIDPGDPNVGALEQRLEQMGR